MIDSLKQLGLSEKEATVFDVLTGFDGLTASHVARKAGIKRASVYDVLRSLQKQGLISHYIKHGYKYFFADSLENLVSIQQGRLKIAKEYVQKAKRRRRNMEIEVMQFRDLQGFIQTYKEVLLSGAKEFVAWSNFESFDSIIDPKDDEVWTQKRMDNGTRPRLIMVDNESSRAFEKEDAKWLRVTKRIQVDKEFSSTLVVCENSVYIFDKSSNILVLKIKSTNVANMLKEIFDSNWESID